MYDLLIRGGHLLTMTGEGVGFVERGAVAIQGRQIAAVGPEAETISLDTPVQTIDATGCLVMPGLIDVHMHSAATVARGLAQEVSAWMGSAYGPIVRHIADEDAPLFSIVALMEGVANGTTTFGDYDAPMMEIAASHDAMGNRAVICQGVTEIDWSKREEWMAQGWEPGDPAFLDPAIGQAEFERELAVFDRWHGTDDGRITNLLGPVAADMVSRELLLRAKDEARRRGTKIHLHVAQDPRENTATMQRYGMRRSPSSTRSGARFGDDRNASLYRDAEEIELVARRGAPMACCTNSIGIIDGIVPPAARFQCARRLWWDWDPIRRHGNNSHNIFAEMRATRCLPRSWRVTPGIAGLGSAGAWRPSVGLGYWDRRSSRHTRSRKEADLIMIDLTGPRWRR